MCYTGRRKLAPKRRAPSGARRRHAFISVHARLKIFGGSKVHDDVFLNEK